MLIQHLFTFAETAKPVEANNELNKETSNKTHPVSPEKAKDIIDESRQSQEIKLTPKPKINVISVKKVQVTGVHIFFYMLMVSLLILSKAFIHFVFLQRAQNFESYCYQDENLKEQIEKGDLDRLTLTDKIYENTETSLQILMTITLITVNYLFPLMYGFSNCIDIYISYIHVSIIQSIILGIMVYLSGSQQKLDTSNFQSLQNSKKNFGILWIFALLFPLCLGYFFTTQEIFQFFKFEIYWKKFCRYWAVSFLFNSAVKYIIVFLINLILISAIIIINKGDTSQFTEKIAEYNKDDKKII